MAKDGKLLYQLTALHNLDSIFQYSLLSRASLAAGSCEDVADGEILTSCHQHGLEHYVPVHFFSVSCSKVAQKTWRFVLCQRDAKYVCR